MKWKIDYIPMFGPDGMAAKFNIKGKTRFGIFIASDLDEGMTQTQIVRCQYWTLAHEIGHILLHGHFILNSSLFQDEEIDETTKGVLEVEAHWFASRLLMPDYLFQDYYDLDPQRLSEKCQVNLEPARRRIDGLNPAFRKMLQEIEPQEVIDERRRKQEDLMRLRYQPIWDRNEETLDLMRRRLGYE